VVSGQALDVVFPSRNQIERIRLLGIDAPDFQQRPWGTKAQRSLEQLIGSKPIRLEFDIEPKDSFQRQLAYVWQNGQLLNEQLVAEGYALAVSKSPNTKYDQRLAWSQERARLLGLGLWNPRSPMRQTPAEFRQQHPKK
jgi:micrococcal nuclease